jgi:hypothetical protein
LIVNERHICAVELPVLKGCDTYTNAI